MLSATLVSLAKNGGLGMSEKDRQEYESARQWARQGLGVLNSGKTQAERDGHLAGLMERQADKRRQETRRVEQALADQRREDRQRELEQVRRDRIEEEIRREEEWKAARRAAEQEEQEQALDKLRYDTRLFGEKVAADRANSFERDAYWFARRELKALVRRTNDRSLAYDLNTVLDGTPEIDLSVQNEPACPAVLQRVGRCLYAFRQSFLDSGYVLPFDFSDPENEVPREVTAESPLIIAGMLNLDGNVSAAPAWLLCDEPLLLLRRINYEENPNEEPCWSLELDADVDEILRRQALPASEAMLLEQMKALGEGLQAALADGLWSVADRWCQWKSWHQPDGVKVGAFDDVLSSPMKTLAFINAHKAFLLRLEVEEPRGLLADIQRPTKRIIEHSQARRRDESVLRDWLRSDDMNPPSGPFADVAFGFYVFRGVEELDKDIHAACLVLRWFRDEVRAAWASVPSNLTANTEHAGKDRRVRFMQVFASRLASPSPNAPLTTKRTLADEVVEKVKRVRASFPVVTQATPPLTNAIVAFWMSTLAFGFPVWLKGSSLSDSLMWGSFAGILFFLVAYVRGNSKSQSTDVSPSVVARAKAWHDAEFESENNPH